MTHEEMWEAVRWALGLDLAGEDLGVGHMAVRAVAVFVAAVAMVRLGDKRFIGRSSAFDLVLGFILGSVVSRAITGNAPFFPTLGAGLVLVGLHWLVAAAAFHSHRVGTLVKGDARRLVEGGEIRWEGMRRSHISEQDLLESLRREGHVSDPAHVEAAWLERSGEVSVIPRGREPRVVELGVEDGVQRLRIELG